MTYASGKPEHIALKDWLSWTWQLKNRLASEQDLLDLGIPPERARAAEEVGRLYRWGLTPYYASLIDPADPACPIALQALPHAAELNDPLGLDDPLDEAGHEPAPGLFHIYPDRIAWCVTGSCQVYCRHCFRKHYRDKKGCRAALEAGFDYLRRTPVVRDVLITGGDPLCLTDAVLEEILRRIRELPHVEIIRIGSRAPAVIPMRITPALCRMLSRFHPLYVNVQFNHPRELTPAALTALDRLCRAGIPLGNQSVLLKGVNDDVDTMRRLVHGLLKARVRPYYIFHPQLLKGTAHLRVPLSKGLEIHHALEGFTSGLAVPLYILDTPYGKVPLSESHIVSREADGFTVRTFRGELWKEREEA